MKKQIVSVHAMHRQRLRLKYTRDEAVMCDHELLELFLFDAVPRYNTNPIAHALLDRFNSLLGVFAADKSELMKIPGVGEGVATYIKETYKEYSDKMRSALITEENGSAAQIHNFMVWHRMNESTIRGNDRYVTVVAVDEDMSVTDIYDCDACDIARAIESEKSRGVHGVIIGTGDVTDDVREALCRDDFVIDALSVKGTEATSFFCDDCKDSER